MSDEGVLPAASQKLHSRIFAVVLLLPDGAASSARCWHSYCRPRRGDEVTRPPAQRASKTPDRRRPSRWGCRAPGTLHQRWLPKRPYLRLRSSSFPRFQCSPRWRPPETSFSPIIAGRRCCRISSPVRKPSQLSLHRRVVPPSVAGPVCLCQSKKWHGHSRR